MKRLRIRTREADAPTPAIAPPGAPTIGTATAGNAQATVTFTPPGDTGGGPITNYRATSSPGGITGTAASSPITVTGLTNGQAYTFTVAAQNAGGFGPESAASNSVTPVANLVANGDFASDTVWTKGTGWTIGSGVATTTGTGSDLSQTISITNGVTYTVTYTITQISATASHTVLLGGTTGTTRNAPGTYVQNIVAGATGQIIMRTIANTGNYSIDNVIVVPA